MDYTQRWFTILSPPSPWKEKWAVHGGGGIMKIQ